ncbi:MAG TPA: O-antigen ligase family protein [Longimicrobiales bacterium]|nr:O-antigen ligase family protein [Longimicrobiales bacterium]
MNEPARSFDAAVPLPESAGAAPAATPPLEVEVAGATSAERRALRILQVGAIFVVLAAVTWKTYELDRFFIPKELVLHLTALAGLIQVRRTLRTPRFGWVDVLLALHLAIGVAGSVLAVNHWNALRGVAITASAIAVFLVARAVSAAGLRPRLLAAIAVAVVIGCITSLMQTYGVETDFFSINRAPGGTFGNRNFVAHMAAFGLPVVLLVTVSARNAGGWLAGALGSAVVIGTLFLTRSRAAWLAAAGALLVLLLALVLAPALRRDGRVWRRTLGIVAIGAAAVVAALLVPNTLEWASANPYLDSMRDVTNYEEGSGAGRLVQYRRSLDMAADNALLGVGPGNWAVHYADYAAGGDPSMSGRTPGMTANPWPSSDWVAFLAERGVAATLLLALAFIAMAVRGMQQLFNTSEPADALRAAALLALLLATAVAGMFDAVLLLALPALLVFTAAGALYEPPDSRVHPGARARSVAFGVLALLVLVASLRSAAQLVAMGIHQETNDATALRAAALVDPGNFRIRVQLARGGSGLGREARCGHAHAAHALYPNAAEARRLSRNCE